MATDSVSTTLTDPSPQTGPSSLGSTFDAEGLPTVLEVPHRKASYELGPSAEPHTITVERPRNSRDVSIDSSMGRSYNEKDMAAEAPQVPLTTTTRRAQHARQRSEAPSGKLRKDDRRNTVASQYAEPTAEQKPKRGGLRNTIRRIFGKRSAKDRISMPAGPVYQNHNPEEFITSATDVETQGRKIERSASVPTNAFFRSSGLSSHPPFQPPLRPPQDPDPPVPFGPERRVSERPQRPRRASVPSVILNRDEMQAITDAMSGLGFQNSQDPDVDTRNIGFAVTNGSNPKRRSRSVGAFREPDHRMSPIQWRHQRTRSDEIKNLRESIDIGAFRKSVLVEKNIEDNSQNVIEDTDVEDPNRDFNFGLQEDDLQGQERIGLEERLVTLEIKLMDFEYALSRIQAGSTDLSRPDSHFEADPGGPSSLGSYAASDAPPMPQDASPVLAQSISRSSSNRFSVNANVVQSKDRPTSVATTLKAGHNKNNSFSKSIRDPNVRTSLSGLTIEHYTTLVTLIRHEQTARVRLEEQVSQLQSQLDRLQGPYPSSHAPESTHSRAYSNHSHAFSNSSHHSRLPAMMHPDGRRGGRVYPEKRPRSSSYSTNETDTEDDYHDAYVTPTNITPVERGEYERGAFDRVPGVEDGEAF